MATTMPAATPTTPATESARTSGSAMTCHGIAGRAPGTRAIPAAVSWLYPSYTPLGARNAPLTSQYATGRAMKSRWRPTSAPTDIRPDRRTTRAPTTIGTT